LELGTVTLKVAVAFFRLTSLKSRKRCGAPTLTLQDMKVREVIRLLEEDGWRQVRMSGSHRQFQHA